MSALCFNDASRRTSEQSLSAILEDVDNTQHPQHLSCSPPSSSSGSSDRFADAPFDYSSGHAGGGNKFTFPITHSLHDSVAHPYAHANVEWSASHYRRQALEEMMKEERRRRRHDRSGHADSIASSSSTSVSISAGLTGVGRIPELIGGAKGDAHGRNESWASTVSGSSISTSAGLAPSFEAMSRPKFGFGAGNQEEKQEFLLGPDSTISNKKAGYGLACADQQQLDMNAFSLESYDKQGVPGSSGPRRFKLGMRSRSDGTTVVPQQEQGGVTQMPAGKTRKTRRPSFVLREVASQSGNPSASASGSIGNDMKDVLDEIIKMEKGFSLDSDKEVSEEERDPLYGRTSVRSNRLPVRSLGVPGRMDEIPATPMAGVERARELTMQPPPAPKAAGAYTTDDTPLPSMSMRPVSVSTAHLDVTPSRELGHLPSRSLNSLLLPPKDYPEGNWELSPGSGHPTKVRSRPTSVSVSGNHRHLRGLSSGQDVLDAMMAGQEDDVVTDLVNGAGLGKEKRMSRMSREYSPESQARGHKIRRSLTFENTPTGPRFPSGATSTPRGMGMSLDTPPSAWESSLSSSRRARGKKVLDDSVTRFQFPRRIDTDLSTDEGGRPEIKIDCAPVGFLAAAHQLDTSDLLTPTQTHFEAVGGDYLTPSNRSSASEGHPVGALEPSLFPPTPGKSFTPAGQEQTGLGAGIRFGALLKTGANDDQDMEL